ncbi:MAG TPA: RNA polymerase sporulation sigma factor SigH [Actinobacteria bacterium]|nr:RNA polymerase sporulation sigma factor SigH [Actinomycetota bacterium]
MAANNTASTRTQDEDLALLAQIHSGRFSAYEILITKYHGFVKLKASSYFMSGGDIDDLVQEGLIGLYKAVRDYRSDREASFRSFAELCITRQIITAIKTASRQKHAPLNSYLSLNHSPGSQDEGDCSLGDILPGSPVHDPLNQVISSEEVDSLKDCLTRLLSRLETRVLKLYLEGRSYEQIAERLTCDTKSVDNALQRIKRKVDLHLQSRQVFL